MSEQNDVTATVLDAMERPDLYISIGVKLVGEENWWLASNAASTQSNIRNNGIIVCIPGHATLRKQAEEREARDAELARLRALCRDDCKWIDVVLGVREQIEMLRLYRQNVSEIIDGPHNSSVKLRMISELTIQALER